jgi:hypothetical protein
MHVQTMACVSRGTSGAVSRRHLVVAGAGFGGVPLAAPWWRHLVGAALASGACRWRVRGSGRSFSGAVVVVGFASSGAAVAFAAAWAGWCGCAVALRRRVSGGVPVWAVSVPVAWPGGQGSGRGGSGGRVWWVSSW